MGDADSDGAADAGDAYSAWSSDRTASFQGGLFDPLHFSTILVTILLLFVVYLLLPKGIRKQYCGAYPKRHAWSARSRQQHRGSSLEGGNAAGGGGSSYYAGGGVGGGSSLYTSGNSTVGTATPYRAAAASAQPASQALGIQTPASKGGIAGTSGGASVTSPNDEIVVSAAMQQLRDPGVLIVAHGSRGKPKTVRLSLTETAITWRTESRKAVTGPKGTVVPPSALPKLGKLHAVPLSHIMYVDVGKQTTALRRVENAPVPETLCFSLLTKEGSLDLEAQTPRERDALVACFSLVLDEVHAQNWRDIYRGPSSDLPSSFDELDPNSQQRPH